MFSVDRSWGVHPMPTVLCDTSDLAEAEAVLSASYSRIRMAASRDTPTHTLLTRSALGALTVDDLVFDFDWHGEMEPPETIIVCRVRSGVIEDGAGTATSRLFGAGGIVCFGGVAGLPVSGGVRRSAYSALSLPRAVLGDVATTVRGSDRVQLTANAPQSEEARTHLCAAIDYICARAGADSGILEQPLVAGAVTRYLADTLLACIPNTSVTEPTVEDRHDGTPLLLRRAMTFIDEHAHRDIALADIAAAISVSPRAVQYMFRRHRGCTPMQYLRSVRLRHAHLDLAMADPAETTVAVVAAKWGFGHAGRFASYYRSTYDRSPNHTLRN
ncbi:MAG: AraC family transcriptional regulator [Mycobacterium sp.]|nr:AraC family transcriptional regulator [Mycobacterium sp.]